MRKRKRLIYALTFLLFFIFIFFYSTNIIATNEKNNLDRLATTITSVESSVAKAVAYQANTLSLTSNSYGLSNAATLQDAMHLLEQQELANEQTYLVDRSGTLHHGGGALEGLLIDPKVLSLASSNGHTVTGLLDLQSDQHFVLLIIPLHNSWSGYVAQVFTGDEFVSQVAEAIPLVGSYLCLFDEWGNPIGAQANQNFIEGTDSDVRDGAAAYSYDAEKNGIQESNRHQYNVYFSATEPHNWFYGSRINSSSFNDMYLFDLPLSAVCMFGILILILAVVVVLDIMNERETHQRISAVGTLDSLTGLCNSVGMTDTLDAYMKKEPVNGSYFVCMDIVSFSRINSMFGHSMGDLLLQVVADVIRERYTCGVRTNADCFVFLAKATPQFAYEAECAFKEAIRCRMGDEYLQMISFKFGLYKLGHYDGAFREVYESALLALKGAKKSLTLSDLVYDAELQNNMELQRDIEMNMMHALSKEEFLVYIQPQIALPAETCERGEALIRWNSSLMGFMPPDKFISLFEGNGFIVETDFFMLRQAMHTVADCIAKAATPPTIAVNQSKVTITFPNYYARLKLLIADFPTVPLRYIELEVTESTLENDWSVIVPLVHSLKKLGFSIAMDDFGSGFSSLNTLRILPIDILKIDRGFLEESEHSERSRIIICSIIRLAKELNIKIICEGVENEVQLQFLKENGCDIAQGYFFSKPIPLNNFLKKYFPTEN